MRALEATTWSTEALAAPAATSVRALFDAHFDFIWRSIRRLGLTDAETDDASQSVFIIASKKLSSIQPGRERAFLFGIAVRVVADVRKSASRRLEVEMDPDVHVATSRSSDVLVDEARARACLDAAISAMPMDLRTVFVLFELEGLTMAQIADVASIPAGTVASRIRRAREHFDGVLRKLEARFGEIRTRPSGGSGGSGGEGAR